MLDAAVFDSHQVARRLWNDGFAVYPFDERLVVEARESFRGFLRRRIERNDSSLWEFTRPGEDADGPDLGLSQYVGTEADVMSGRKKDCKARLHDDCSLRRRLKEGRIRIWKEDSDFLALNQKLRNVIEVRSHQIAVALDLEYDLNCSCEVLSCQQILRPYTTSVLRSLYYPATRETGGAGEHRDRGFLTNHLGDVGGRMEGYVDRQWENISPPTGHAVVFFGVKALWVSKGTKLPLLHRSVTNPGEDRFANVHFGHVCLRDYVVTDAKRAAEDFEKRFRHEIEDGTYRWQI